MPKEPVPLEDVMSEIVRRALEEYTAVLASNMVALAVAEKAIRVHLERAREGMAAKGEILDVDKAFKVGWGSCLALCVRFVEETGKQATEVRVGKQEPPSGTAPAGPAAA